MDDPHGTLNEEIWPASKQHELTYVFPDVLSIGRIFRLLSLIIIKRLKQFMFSISVVKSPAGWTCGSNRYLIEQHYIIYI